MSAARVVSPRRIVACALALSLLAAAFRPASAGAPTGGGSETAESKVGVIMAVACGFALKFVLAAPVPMAGVAAAACSFAFLDAAMSSDDSSGSSKP